MELLSYLTVRANAIAFVSLFLYQALRSELTSITTHINLWLEL